MTPADLLNGLTEPQREAVTHAEGPLLVLAGPGSGKTRVITHRAAYLAATVTQPRHILAITFTNKAAGEMAERLDRLVEGRGVTCSTFHSFCARLLRTHAERAGLQPSFSIFDQGDQLAVMKEAIARVGLSADNFPPSKILSRVSRAKNDMRLPEQFASGAHDWQSRKMAEIYAAYNDLLAEQSALDFDDLLVKTALLLGRDGELRGQLQDRYRYVLVDEYQDTNHAQYLIARGLSLDHQNLCVTGDPDQSIYAWRGANLHNILQFEEDFPGAKVVRLEQNYRSTPQILAAADGVIAHNRKRKKKKLWTENKGGPAVRMAECEDAGSEARYVALQVAEHVRGGGSYSDVAVFYRLNALSRQLELALLEARIPFQVARGVAFYNRREIKDVLAYLKLAVNSLDRVSLLRVMNTPARGIGKTTVQRILDHASATNRAPLAVLDEPEEIPNVGRSARSLKAFARLIVDLVAVAGRGSVKDSVEFITRHSGLVAMWSNQDDDGEVLANVNELINAAAEYDRQHADGSGSLADWLQQVSLVSDVDAVDPDVGAVTLMTLHAAKGLEFDTVFVMGMEEGLLPYERSEAERPDYEEERRLCFVGMTRAQRMLTLTSARWRDRRGISQRTARSRFLRELPKEQVEWVAIGKDGLPGYDDAAKERGGPRPTSDFADWRPGQYVLHPEYGLGQVQWIRPGSPGLHAGIHFRDRGMQTIILEYADLKRVEPDELD